MQKKHQDWTIIKRLGDVILQNVEGCIIEVGLGKSTHIFIELADRFKRKHYCFDEKERKCVWAIKYGSKAFTGSSPDILQKFPRIPVAMGLIDGDHRSEIAVQEVELFLKRLTIGGVLFLHDTYPPEKFVREDGNGKGKVGCGDVYRVRQKLERRKDLQVFTWPYSAADCGLTMVMKKDPDRPKCRW